MQQQGIRKLIQRQGNRGLIQPQLQTIGCNVARQSGDTCSQEDFNAKRLHLVASEVHLYPI